MPTIIPNPLQPYPVNSNQNPVDMNTLYDYLKNSHPGDPSYPKHKFVIHNNCARY